jgi:di/tricarboxylate transporter
MTAEIALLLIVLVAAIVLFSFEWFSADVVALGIVLVLVITGLLPADKAFLGFGSDAVMMILGLLIMTAALFRTGVVDMAGRLVSRYAGDNPNRLLLAIMIAVAALSAFISNTAATAFFLPIAFGAAARAKVATSRILMPLAFASILTSSTTLISTSTNIIVSDLMVRHTTGASRLAPLGMFELAPVGIPIAVLGLAYMWLVGRRLLPDRPPAEGQVQEFGLTPYVTEAMVLPGSPLVGKSLDESHFGRDMDLTVLRIVRGKTQYLAPTGDDKLAVGDVLLVEGLSSQILKIKDEAGIDLKSDVKLSDPMLQAEDVALVEALLLPHSPLIGRTLKTSRFRDRYGLQVLGLKRAGGTMLRKISQVRLRMGDVLLIQGHRNAIKALEESDELRILGTVSNSRPNRRLAPLVVAIFVGSLALATTKVLSLPVATLLGAVLVFGTRAMSPEEAYREIEWKAVIVIGSMLALGSAMAHTGADRFLADRIANFTAGVGPVWLLTGFFALTLALTQPMSNQAAAAVVLPVALETAAGLGLNPRAFAIMGAVAGSCSFLTPLEPSCLLVYGPGRYRFFDFFKVGALLTIVIYAVAIVIVPWQWPLRP